MSQINANIGNAIGLPPEQIITQDRFINGKEARAFTNSTLQRFVDSISSGQSSVNRIQIVQEDVNFLRAVSNLTDQIDVVYNTKFSGDERSVNAQRSSALRETANTAVNLIEAYNLEGFNIGPAFNLQQNQAKLNELIPFLQEQAIDRLDGIDGIESAAVYELIDGLSDDEFESSQGIYVVSSILQAPDNEYLTRFNSSIGVAFNDVNGNQILDKEEDYEFQAELDERYVSDNVLTLEDAEVNLDRINSEERPLFYNGYHPASGDRLNGGGSTKLSNELSVRTAGDNVNPEQSNTYITYNSDALISYTYRGVEVTATQRVFNRETGEYETIRVSPNNLANPFDEGGRPNISEREVDRTANIFVQNVDWGILNTPEEDIRAAAQDLSQQGLNEE